MTRRPATTPVPVGHDDAPTAVCPLCDGRGAVDEDVAGFDPLLSACHVVVLRAMERAGKRLLSSGPRSYRGQFRDVPAHLLHTRIPPDPAGLDRLLSGAWDAVPSLVDEWGGPCGSPAAQVVRVLDRYCRDLLVSGYGHEVRNLRFSLQVVCR